MWAGRPSALPCPALPQTLEEALKLPAQSRLLPQSRRRQDCPPARASPVEEVPPSRAPHSSQEALPRGGPVPPLSRHPGTAPNTQSLCLQQSEGDCTG